MHVCRVVVAGVVYEDEEQQVRRTCITRRTRVGQYENGGRGCVMPIVAAGIAHSQDARQLSDRVIEAWSGQSEDFTGRLA
jgi:hypothetical protein